jgi:hypothetical protein
MLAALELHAAALAQTPAVNFLSRHLKILSQF